MDYRDLLKRYLHYMSDSGNHHQLDKIIPGKPFMREPDFTREELDEMYKLLREPCSESQSEK